MDVTGCTFPAWLHPWSALRALQPLLPLPEPVVQLWRCAVVQSCAVGYRPRVGGGGGVHEKSRAGVCPFRGSGLPRSDIAVTRWGSSMNNRAVCRILRTTDVSYNSCQGGDERSVGV